MKGPSLRQVTVRVRPMDKTLWNTNKNRWMATLSGLTKGPSQWHTTAKANTAICREMNDVEVRTIERLSLHWQTYDADRSFPLWRFKMYQLWGSNLWDATKKFVALLSQRVMKGKLDLQFRTFAIARLIICLLFVLPPLDMLIVDFVFSFAMPPQMCRTVGYVITMITSHPLWQMDRIKVQSQSI